MSNSKLMNAQPRDRRERLIAAATELFLAHPYDEVTTTAIATRAEVAYGLIAHYFGNKRGLYLATIASHADQLRAARAAIPAGDTPLEQLRNGLAHHIQYIDEHAEAYLALTRGGLGADPDVRALIDALRWEGGEQILDRLAPVQPDHPLVRTAMLGWLGFLDGIVVEHLQRPQVAIEQLVDLAAATLHTTLLAIQDTAGLDADIVRTLRPSHRVDC